MIWVGLTGSIATGKSQVARLLEERGWAAVSADKLAQKALEKHSPCWLPLVEGLGEEILNDRGQICRQSLAELVFKDSEKLRFVESVVHPFVREESHKAKQELKAQGVSHAVYEVPLLFENNLENQYDLTVTVSCPEHIQKERAAIRGFTEEQLQSRLDHQMSLTEKIQKADFVIDNSGDLDFLNQSLDQFLEFLKSYKK